MPHLLRTITSTIPIITFTSPNMATPFAKSAPIPFLPDQPIITRAGVCYLVYNIIMKYRTIIADSYARKHLFSRLTSQSDIVLSTQVLSLSSFRQSLADSSKDDLQQFTEIYAALKDHISSDNIYHEELKYPAFARYFYDFTNFMIENGITVDQLPQETSSDINKKEIISYIYSQPLSSHLTEERFNELTDCSNIQIYRSFQIAEGGKYHK